MGEATDVLYVPLQAINAREGRLFCYVEAGGKIQAKRAGLGRSNETHVEVVSGISEGDVVLLYDPELPDAEDAFPDDGDEESGATQLTGAKRPGDPRANRGNMGDGRGHPGTNRENRGERRGYPGMERGNRGEGRAVPAASRGNRGERRGGDAGERRRRGDRGGRGRPQGGGDKAPPPKPSKS